MGCLWYRVSVRSLFSAPRESQILLEQSSKLINGKNDTLLRNIVQKTNPILQTFDFIAKFYTAFKRFEATGKREDPQ